VAFPWPTYTRLIASPQQASRGSFLGPALTRQGGFASHRQLGPALTATAIGVNSVSFSSDGKPLATGRNDDSVRLWDVASHRQVGSALTGHATGVGSVSFSSDGKTLASGDGDNSVRLWNLSHLHDPASFCAHPSANLHAPAVATPRAGGSQVPHAMPVRPAVRRRRVIVLEAQDQRIRHRHELVMTRTASRNPTLSENADSRSEPSLFHRAHLWPDRRSDTLIIELVKADEAPAVVIATVDLCEPRVRRSSCEAVVQAKELAEQPSRGNHEGVSQPVLAHLTSHGDDKLALGHCVVQVRDRPAETQPPQ
jgi:WD domain, G-beta repeat